MINYVLWFIRDLHWHVESSFGAPVSVKSTSSVFSNACNSSGHLQSIHHFESKSVPISKYSFSNLGDKIPFLRDIFCTNLDDQICFERKTCSQTWTMAAFSTHRFGPGFRAAAFWSKGRNALREKRHNSFKKSGTRDDFTHLARNWGAMQLVI